MNDDKDIDARISELVRSVGGTVPAEVETHLRRRAAAFAPRPASRTLRLLWPLAPVGAALALASLILIIPSGGGTRGESPTEIITRFEIPDKAISIVFIQKPGFKLIQED